MGDRPSVTIEGTAPGSEARDGDRSLQSQDTVAADDRPAGDHAVVVVRLADADPHRYVVLQEFARGGLGRILRVEDRRLGRVVAIKQMLHEGGSLRARFTREATITARLAHPAIVPVHDVGRWPSSGEPFYSMKLVSGRSLREVVDGARTLDERLALVPNVIAVADAIAYAHSEGVIHRDLKPDNVLVGAFGETVVIDWGIAKDLQRAAAGDDEITAAGAILGTPHYMPPEQAEGRPVDERADVYALGALLYDVLTGAPPFAGVPSREVLAALRRGEGPPPVTEREREIPPDLATVVQKAMSRSPEGRYPSARELAEDLRRFQTGRLVSAHQYGRWTLFTRWLRRYRAPVSVAAVALLVLAVVGVVSVERVIAERNVARRRTEQLLLTQARGALERDPTEALAWLSTYPDDGEGWGEVRSLAMDAVARGVARHVPPPRGFFAFTADGRGFIGARDAATLEIRDVERGLVTTRLPYRGRVDRVLAAPDGRTLAVVNAGGSAVTLYDTTSGATRVLPAHRVPIVAAAISPDGRWVASGSDDGSLQLWPIGGGEGRALQGNEGAIFGVAFSRDGRWLISLAAEPTGARLFQVDGDQQRAVARGLDRFAGAVSPDGSLVAFAQRDGGVSLWSASTGERVRELGAHRGKANDVAFSPDGRWVASGGDDGLVSLWPVAGGERRRLSGHAAAVESLAFSPDGRWLVSGSADGEARLWQVDGDEERVLGRSPGRIIRLTFSPDGTRVASEIAAAGEGHEARIWDVSVAHTRVLRGHEGVVFHAVFSPDGRTVATASEDGTIRLWDVATGGSRKLSGHRDLVYRVAFSPDGSKLASASFDRTARLWSPGACAAPSCAEERVLAGHEGRVSMLAFSPDGRRLATASADATVRLWDAASGEARVLRGHARDVANVAFSPDGKLLASVGTDAEIRLWDVATGASRSLSGHGAQVHKVLFSGDGRRLFTASADQTIRRWDVATGAARILIEHLADPVLALSPDDRVLAVSGDGGRVLLVDPETGSERRIGGHQGLVYRLAFGPDGATLASAGRDHAVRLWSVARGTLDAVYRHDAEVSFIAFSPDGRWLTAAGAVDTARILLVASHAEVPTTRPLLRSWMSGLSTAALDAEQHLVSP
jgi:WD40 repeat protein